MVRVIVVILVLICGVVYCTTPHDTSRLARSTDGLGLYRVVVDKSMHVHDVMNNIDGHHRMSHVYENGFYVFLEDDIVYQVSHHKYVTEMIMVEYPPMRREKEKREFYENHHVLNDDHPTQVKRCGVRDDAPHEDEFIDPSLMRYRRVDHLAVKSGEHTQNYVTKLNCDPRTSCVMLQVPVDFHLPTTNSITSSTLDSQITVANNLYNAFGFNFVRRNTYSHVTTNCETTCKNQAGSTTCSNCRGNYSPPPKPLEAIQVYVAASSAIPGLLGYSFLPDQLPEGNLNQAVVIADSSLPGGTAPYDLGQTFSHELGHYLGLEHTFNNNCNAPGDYVSDTPPENGQHFGCPSSQTQSCPGQQPWSKHNIMSYYDDACLTLLTAGQGYRVNQEFTQYKPVLFAASAANTTATDPCNGYTACGSNGVCVSPSGTAECQCNVGYEGTTCSVTTDTCTPNPCGDGYQCTTSVGSFVCTCIKEVCTNPLVVTAVDMTFKFSISYPPPSTFTNDFLTALRSVLSSVSPNRLSVNDVRQGSVLVDFRIAPGPAGEATPTQVASNLQTMMHQTTSALRTHQFMISNQLSAEHGAPSNVVGVQQCANGEYKKDCSSGSSSSDNTLTIVFSVLGVVIGLVGVAALVMMWRGREKHHKLKRNHSYAAKSVATVNHQPQLPMRQYKQAQPQQQTSYLYQPQVAVYTEQQPQYNANITTYGEGEGANRSGDWDEYYTDDGVPYYVNNITQESRWERPW